MSKLYHAINLLKMHLACHHHHHHPHLSDFDMDALSPAEERALIWTFCTKPIQNLKKAELPPAVFNTGYFHQTIGFLRTELGRLFFL